MITAVLASDGFSDVHILKQVLESAPWDVSWFLCVKNSAITPTLENLAYENDIPCSVIQTDYNIKSRKKKKKDLSKRTLGYTESLIVIWNNEKTGMFRQMINKCKKAGIPVYIYILEEV